MIESKVEAALMIIRADRVNHAQKVWNESGDAINAMLNFADEEADNAAKAAPMRKDAIAAVLKTDTYDDQDRK